MDRTDIALHRKGTTDHPFESWGDLIRRFEKKLDQPRTGGAPIYRRALRQEFGNQEWASVQRSISRHTKQENTPIGFEVDWLSKYLNALQNVASDRKSERVSLLASQLLEDLRMSFFQHSATMGFIPDPYPPANEYNGLLTWLILPRRVNQETSRLQWLVRCENGDEKLYNHSLTWLDMLDQSRPHQRICASAHLDLARVAITYADYARAEELCTRIESKRKLNRHLSKGQLLSLKRVRQRALAYSVPTASPTIALDQLIEHYNGLLPQIQNSGLIEAEQLRHNLDLSRSTLRTALRPFCQICDNEHLASQYRQALGPIVKMLGRSLKKYMETSHIRRTTRD